MVIYVQLLACWMQALICGTQGSLCFPHSLLFHNVGSVRDPL